MHIPENVGFYNWLKYLTIISIITYCLYESLSFHSNRLNILRVYINLPNEIVAIFQKNYHKTME